MVTKPCPKCKQHLPVACKACPCGHVFFVARRPISIQKSGSREQGGDVVGGGGSSGGGEVKRRRTERTKRVRPDYFNSLQVENQWKRLKTLQKSRQRTENSTSSSTNEIEGEGSNSEESGSVNNSGSGAQGGSGGGRPKKRGRPKKNFSKSNKDQDMSKISEREAAEAFANLSKEKEIQFSIVLAEINRKMWSQQFHP